MAPDKTPLERLTRVETLLEAQGRQLEHIIQLTEKNTNFRVFMAGVGTVAGAVAGTIATIVLSFLGLRG